MDYYIEFSVTLHLLQLKDSETWPQLGECAFMALESLEAVAKELDSMQDVIQGLLEHFFSEHRCYYHKKDVQWVLKLANEEIVWKCKPVKVFTDSTSTGIALGVVKNYLLRILHQQSSCDKRTSTALTLFNPEVCALQLINQSSFTDTPCTQNRIAVGAKLVGSLGEEGAIQYTPYFYDMAHAVCHIWLLILVPSTYRNTCIYM